MIRKPRKRKYDAVDGVESDNNNSDVSEDECACEDYHFSPDELKGYQIFFISGAKGSGKTHLTTYLMSQRYKEYDEVHLYSGTSVSQPNAWRFIPNIHKHNGLDLTDLTERLKRQEERVSEEFEKLTREPGFDGWDDDTVRDKINKKVPHVCIILDDIISDPRIRSSNVIKDIFISCRHLRVSFYILVQCPAKGASVSNLMRENVDYCFAARSRTVDSLEALAMLYFSSQGVGEGMRRVSKITSSKHAFAVSKCCGDRTTKLRGYTCRYKCPKTIPKFTLKSTKEMMRMFNVKTMRELNHAASGDTRLRPAERAKTKKGKKRKRKLVIEFG